MGLFETSDELSQKIGKGKCDMLRSMYSGIGGMKNFQTKLDVIGNNIANVNTYGFKKGRTIFKDLVSQEISGASAPVAGAVGGTNPKQVVWALHLVLSIRCRRKEACRLPAGRLIWPFPVTDFLLSVMERMII